MITGVSSSEGKAAHSTQHLPDTRLHGRWLLIAQVGFVALLATVVALNILMLPDFYASQFTPHIVQALHRIGLSPTVYALVNLLESVIPTLTYLAMGCLIFWRRSNERMALFCAVMLVTFGGVAANPLDDATGGGAMPQPMASITLLRAVVHLLVVAGQVSIVVFLYLFPTGRFVPRWTRWCALLALIYWFANVFFPTQIPAQLSSSQSPWILVFWMVGVIAQVYRYRRVSTPVEREQTKWVVFGSAIAFSIVAVPSVLEALPLIKVNDAAFSNPPDVQSALAGMLISATWVVAVQVIPIFIAIAILRSHLWDIDIIINRALVYGLLTALLAALYAGLTIGLQALSEVITGQASQPPVVIVASTLAIAALFQPLRRRLQTVIDRRFYRRKYDAAKTLAGFSTTLRSQVDLNELQAHLLAVTQETMQPAQVSLWLREPEQRRHGD